MTLDRLIQAASKIVFDHRKVWLVIFSILTVLFVVSASRRPWLGHEPDIVMLRAGLLAVNAA